MSDAGAAPRTGVEAGKIRVTLKLFASLTVYLPEAYRKSYAMPLAVDAEATIASLIAPFGMPPALVKLVVLNGVFVPEREWETQDGAFLANVREEAVAA